MAELEDPISLKDPGVGTEEVEEEGFSPLPNSN